MRRRADTWVIIPAFNEERVISKVLNQFTKLPYGVVVVDDGSTDQTLDKCRQFPVEILHHKVNLGQGAALRTGIKFALKFPKIRYLVTFDADGQHRVQDVKRMLFKCKSGRFDIVLGSRFLKSGKAVNIDRLKKFILRLAVIFTRITTGLSLTDTHNGLRVMTAKAARKIKITHNGMAHASDIIFQVALHKLKYCEVPVVITYTTYSKKKGQRLINSLNILWTILREVFR